MKSMEIVLERKNICKKCSKTTHGRMYYFDKIAIQVSSSFCFYDFLKETYIEKSHNEFRELMFRQNGTVKSETF